MKSTNARYGAVTVTLHCVSALLILVLLVSGLRAEGAPDAETKAAILSSHIPLGATVLLLTLARLFWHTVVDRTPAPLPMPK